MHFFFFFFRGARACSKEDFRQLDQFIFVQGKQASPRYVVAYIEWILLHRCLRRFFFVAFLNLYSNTLPCIFFTSFILLCYWYFSSNMLVFTFQLADVCCLIIIRYSCTYIISLKFCSHCNKCNNKSLVLCPVDFQL